MRILTVAFFDDNYGDMLIRTCFLQLTKVVLKNLGVNDYTLDVMPLKSPDDSQIAAADLIVFPGGAMFGINYLGVAAFIERVLDIADAKGTPVVFGSLGFNHMEDSDAHDDRLHAILSRRSIRAVSVRDSEDIFRRYAGEQAYEIQPVCDPAVWIEAVYAHDIEKAYEKKREAHTPVIGINVVRGGLFKDNGVDWTLTKEEEYLAEFMKLLDERGLEYRFFTNGSTWDVNTLKHFQNKYKIDREKVIFSDTSREVVQAIAGFDAVIAIRMHASIISYGLSVPSINYVWNPKIPELYKKIGYPDRAVRPAEWSAQSALEKLEVLLGEEDYRPDPALLMTLYRFLYETFGAILAPEGAEEMYGFDTVRDTLRGMSVPAAEDDTDMRTKLQRAQNRYYALFQSDDRKKGEIRALQKENQKLSRQIGEERKKREKAEKERDAAKKELERLQQKLIFRAYKKLIDNSKN